MNILGIFDAVDLAAAEEQAIVYRFAEIADDKSRSSTASPPGITGVSTGSGTVAPMKEPIGMTWAALTGSRFPP
jgi:hypothetical protein